MKDFICVVFLSLAIVSTATTAQSESADIKKCTCDLVKEEVQNNGAWVRNATACWSSDNPNRQWCKIDVAELERNGEARSTVSFFLETTAAGDVDALANEVTSLFLQYAKQQQEISGEETFDYSTAIKQLPDLIGANAKNIFACTEMFLMWHEKRVAAAPVETERFRCEVRGETGWLSLKFRFDGFDIRYMVAPNG